MGVHHLVFFAYKERSNKSQPTAVLQNRCKHKSFKHNQHYNKLFVAKHNFLHEIDYDIYSKT